MSGRVVGVVGALLVLAAVAAGCSEQGNVFSLEAGSCFDDPDGLEVSSVTMVECSEPHDNEVFATFEAPGGDFPGTTEIQSLAETGCLERFEAYVGIDYNESEYFLNYLTPTSEGWDQIDDREIVCYLFGTEKTTGSVKGSGS